MATHSNLAMLEAQPWLLTDYDYQLPSHAIATEPASVRSQSRLLHLSRTKGILCHARFEQLIDYLHAGDVLVLNDTRVMAARLEGHKHSGARVDILVERILSEKQALVHMRANKPIKIGSSCNVAGTQLLVKEKVSGRFIVELQASMPWEDWLAQHGAMPLPPYMKRSPQAQDSERYQTVYAQLSGSIAAPTAGLHFDEALLLQLQKKGVQLVFVTLHIGYGTFEPVRVADIRLHKLHHELVTISKSACDVINQAKQNKQRVIAVGTTVVRALEAAWSQDRLCPLHDWTNLFIYPGYSFKVIDGLITNFHLPKSSLLMLVCAFAGYSLVMSAYATAIEQGYRFYSYGDAMYIDATP